ncbi:MAG TPA: hypothetical protein VJJ20_03730 [Candidatus Paceibacterota bacterium]
MRARVNSYIGFAFVASFSWLMGTLVVEAFKSLPSGLPLAGF